MAVKIAWQTVSPVVNRGGTRSDIQAMRALAVSLVVIYHIRPDGLSGGFVGVDVFFVVSGFLITGHLLQHPPRSFSDVVTFWSRRIRRLLPASLLVLAVTLVATRIVAPSTQWLAGAQQAAASALYVVNWFLAADSVDYLAAENPPSAVQHFWSLSVEEQFYFVWPVLIGLLVWAGARRQGSSPLARGLVIVGLASFAYSVVATAITPAAAYFVTPARVWEFVIGALAALLVRRGLGSVGSGWERRAHVRALVALVGLVMIVGSAVIYDHGTPFPGWQAAVPTLGAVLVVLARVSPGEGPLATVLAWRPLTWIGDISYSIYLWHWPMIVLLPYLSNTIGLLDTAAILLATIILAALTRTHVEERFRRPAPIGDARRVFVATALGMSIVTGLSFLQLVEVRHLQRQSSEAVSSAIERAGICLGAGSLADPQGCRGVTDGMIVPTPADAPNDKSAAYKAVGGKDCWASIPDFPLIRCTFGDPDGTVDVALVGNSHSGQWLPALEVLAAERGWRITTYLASRCAMVPTDQALPTARNTAACRTWGERVVAALQTQRPDLIVLSNRISLPASAEATVEASFPAYQAGYRTLFADLQAADLTTAVIADTPAPGAAGHRSIPECVARFGEERQRCASARDEAVPAEPAAAVLFGSDQVQRLIDLNDLICTAGQCDPVVGGVLVYFDASHLTASYARTLAPYLGDELEGMRIAQ